MKLRLADGESSIMLSLSSSVPSGDAPMGENLQVDPLDSDNLSREASCVPASGYVLEGKKACFVGVGGRSESLMYGLSCLAEGDWHVSSPSTLTKLLRRESSGLFKLLPKMPMPRANGPELGRVVCGLNGEEGAAKDWRTSFGFSDAFCAVGSMLMDRLHGVSGMCLLNPRLPWASTRLRFFLEISPVDMNAAGRGFTSL